MVNLDKVSMVEPFKVAATQVARCNARIFVAGSAHPESSWLYIQETPAEFQAKANELLRSAGDEPSLVNTVTRQLGPDYDGPG